MRTRFERTYDHVFEMLPIITSDQTLIDLFNSNDLEVRSILTDYPENRVMKSDRDGIYTKWQRMRGYYAEQLRDKSLIAKLAELPPPDSD